MDLFHGKIHIHVSESVTALQLPESRRHQSAEFAAVFGIKEDFLNPSVSGLVLDVERIEIIGMEDGGQIHHPGSHYLHIPLKFSGTDHLLAIGLFVVLMGLEHPAEFPQVLRKRFQYLRLGCLS